MLNKSIAAATLLAATTICTSLANATEALYQAMTAAMGETIEDPCYLDVLSNYGMPAPDFKNDKSLVNSVDYPYPTDVESGTLLHRVLETEKLRLGWIAVRVPWLVPGAPDPDKPVGLSVEYWDVIRDKLNNHYSKDINLHWVE